MNLVQLIYTSRVTSGLGPNEIKMILEKANEHNSRQGVTGMLCFCSDYFLQCIEGSRDAVNKTYNKIQNDQLHYDITLIKYSEIDARDFMNWSMGYVGITNDYSDILFRYSTERAFNPYQLSAKSARNMMLDIAEKSITIVPAHRKAS